MKLEQLWFERESPTANEIFDNFSAIAHDSVDLRANFLDFLRLYDGKAREGLGSRNYTQEIDTLRLKFNVAKSLTNTIVSKISTKKIKPRYLTSGGTAKSQRKAKNLNHFTLGIHAETKLHGKCRQVFKDGALFGRGLLKVWNDTKKIFAERVLPSEIFVDQEDAKYGEPATLYQHKEISKQSLQVQFPDFANEIAASDLLQFDTRNGKLKASNDLNFKVSVIESWHLPSTEESGDGRHVIAVSGAVLFEEEWTKDHFPFATFEWEDPTIGYWPCGLVEEVSGIQLEINAILDKIQEEMARSAFYIMVEKNSEVTVSHITNEDGSIIHYTGAQPQFVTPNTVASQSFQQLDRLFNKAYEITGISSLSAQSIKPAGLDSGVALREYSDIESSRFLFVEQKYEEFVLAATELLIEQAREIKGYGVMAPLGDSLERIKWSEINLPKDQYTMRLFATNAFSDTPAARLQEVTEAVKNNMLPSEEAFELLDFPDLEGYKNRKTAGKREIELAIQAMVEKQEPRLPSQWTNLALAGRTVHDALVQAENAEEDPISLELMSNYLGEVERLQKLAAPPAPAPQGPSAQVQPVPQGLPAGAAQRMIQTPRM